MPEGVGGGGPDPRPPFGSAHGVYSIMWVRLQMAELNAVRSSNRTAEVGKEVRSVKAELERPSAHVRCTEFTVHALKKVPTHPWVGTFLGGDDSEPSVSYFGGLRNKIYL